MRNNSVPYIVQRETQATINMTFFVGFTIYILTIKYIVLYSTILHFKTRHMKLGWFIGETRFTRQ